MQFLNYLTTKNVVHFRVQSVHTPRNEVMQFVLGECIILLLMRIFNANIIIVNQTWRIISEFHCQRLCLATLKYFGRKINGDLTSTGLCV